MNREICAYLLLIALFLGSLYNIHVMDTKIGSLRTQAEKAYESTLNGDFEKADRQLRAAADRWLHMDEYTHIFIRHTEIDSATDAFSICCRTLRQRTQKAPREAIASLTLI